MRRVHDWSGILGDLVEVRQSQLQLSQYVAVLAGIRRSMDDWIRADRWPAYQRLARRLGLTIEVDCVFKDRVDRSVSGDAFAPTTRAHGFRFPEGLDQQPTTTVHVFVSTRPDWATAAFAAGWYPVAVEDRVVCKPMVDHRKLGHAFGYPECCVDFFLQNNDWPRMNTLAEAARRSDSFSWKTNCLLKHTPFMLNFHMPCSFDCGRSDEYGHRLLEAIRDLDQAYASRIEDHLRRPYLVINERCCMALLGGQLLARDRATYERAEYVGHSMILESSEARYAHGVERGDQLWIEDGILYLYKRGELVDCLETRCDAGVAEVPTLLGFA